MKKKILISVEIVVLVIIVIFLVRFFSGAEDFWACTPNGWEKHGNPNEPKPEAGCGKVLVPEEKQLSREENIIGGDQDENGCLGAAGYAWCPSTKKCQRMWEEYCEEYKDQYRGKANEKTDKSDLIQVSNIKAGDVITSPLVIKGKARGTWFFEGSFPLILTDWDGRIIAESYASAQGEWMTEDFVPFDGTIQFEKPKNAPSRRGTLILRKDNPSDQRELDDALEISIEF